MLYLALTRLALTWGVPFEVLALNVMVTFAAGLELSVPTIWRSPGLFWRQRSRSTSHCGG